MEPELPQNPAEVRALVLLEVQLVFMHRLLLNQKTLFTSGTLKIAKLQNNKTQPVFFINLNSFYYGIHPETFFIKVIYDDTVAYVFPHFQNGLSAVSIPIISPHIAQLDQLLGQAARLIDYKTAFQIANLRDLITQNYPQLQKEQIYYPDNIKKVISTAGNFLGKAFETVGGYVKTGVEKAGNYVTGKVAQGEPTHIEEATKEKWQKLKDGTNNFIHVSADFAGKLFTPVVTKAKQYTNQFGDKINRSQNQTVKYAKELAQVSGRAIGEAFGGLVKGGTEVVTQIGSQGKKLITKKYGGEVIQTFAGQEEPKEGEKKEEHAEHVEHAEPKPKGEQPKPSGSGGDTQVRLNETAEHLYPSLEK